MVVGTAASGAVASLEIRRRGVWRTLDRDRTAASGRYVLRARVRRTMAAPVRVSVGASEPPSSAA